MNVFLRTRLFRNLITYDPNKLRLDYTSAYSLFPGKIHVEGLEIRGRDSAVEWILRLDTCDFRVSFFDLPRRHFRADHVRGDGLSLRVRLQEDRPNPKHDAALPPVPGFADPPLHDIGVRRGELTDDEYALWEVHLEDVEAFHVRELWIDTVRYTGDMHIHGRWLFRPVRWLEVGPATLEMNAVRLGFGEDDFLTDGKGKLDLTVHPFDVRKPEGMGIMQFLSASGSLTATLDAAAAAQAFGSEGASASASVVRAQGPLGVEVRIDHGVLMPGLRVHSEFADAQAAVKGATIDGSVRVDVAVAPAGTHGALFTAKVEGVSLTAEKALKVGYAQASVHGVSAVLSSHELDLARPFGDFVLGVDVDALRAPSLSAWRALVAPSPDVMNGVTIGGDAATFGGHFEGSLEKKVGTGRATFAIERASATRDNDSVVTDLSGAVEMKDIRWGEGRFDLSGSRVEAVDSTARVKGVGVRVARVVVAGNTVQLRAGQPPDVRVDVGVGRLRVADLRDGNSFLSKDEGSLRLLGGRATVSANAHVSSRDTAVTGTAHADLEDAQVSIKHTLVRGNVEARVALHRYDWKENLANLTGSEIIVRDAEVTEVKGDAATRLMTVPLLTVSAPALSFDHQGPHGTASVDLVRVNIDNLANAALFLPLPKDVSVEAGKATAAGRMDVHLDSMSLRGNAEIDGEAMSLRVASGTWKGDLKVSVRAKDDGPFGMTDMSGTSVAFDGAASPTDSPSPKPEEERWWARVTLPEASMRLRGGLQLKSKLHMTAKDASPATALVADNTAVPKWIANAFTMKGLEADGDVFVTPSAIEVRSFQAHGGQASVRFDYAKQDAHKEGALLIGFGILQAGVGVGDQGTKVVLVDAEEWFRKKEASLRAASKSHW